MFPGELPTYKQHDQTAFTTDSIDSETHCLHRE
jgi:hypothetical protein